MRDGRLSTPYGKHKLRERQRADELVELFLLPMGNINPNPLSDAPVKTELSTHYGKHKLSGRRVDQGERRTFYSLWET